MATYDSKDLLVAVKAFARGNALPLDKDEYWISSFVKLNDNFTLIGSGNCK